MISSPGAGTMRIHTPGVNSTESAISTQIGGDLPGTSAGGEAEGCRGTCRSRQVDRHGGPVKAYVETSAASHVVRSDRCVSRTARRSPSV